MVYLAKNTHYPGTKRISFGSDFGKDTLSWRVYKFSWADGFYTLYKNGLNLGAFIYLFEVSFNLLVFLLLLLRLRLVPMLMVLGCWKKRSWGWGRSAEQGGGGRRRRGKRREKKTYGAKNCVYIEKGTSILIISVRKSEMMVAVAVVVGVQVNQN